MAWWFWVLVGVATGGVGFYLWFAWYFRDLYH